MIWLFLLSTKKARMKTLTKEMQAAITPAMALDLLKEGNKRFVNNLKVNRNLLQQANETSDGQHPFAVILSCIDSRTSAELIFDQGLGDGGQAGSDLHHGVTGLWCDGGDDGLDDGGVGQEMLTEALARNVLHRPGTAPLRFTAGALRGIR